MINSTPRRPPQHIRQQRTKFSQPCYEKANKKPQPASLVDDFQLKETTRSSSKGISLGSDTNHVLREMHGKISGQNREPLMWDQQQYEMGLRKVYSYIRY